jgi:hypothetical protein
VGYLLILFDLRTRPAHQVKRLLPRRSYFLQQRFGRDSPVHQPHPSRFAILASMLSGKAHNAVFSDVLPAIASYARGTLAGVTIGAITTCLQSGRLSRL